MGTTLCTATLTEENHSIKYKAPESTFNPSTKQKNVLYLYICTELHFPMYIHIPVLVLKIQLDRFKPTSPAPEGGPQRRLRRPNLYRSGKSNDSHRRAAKRQRRC